PSPATSTFDKRPSRTACRRSSKFLSTADLNRSASRTPAATKRMILIIAAEAVSLKASELDGIIRLGNAIAQAPDGAQHVDTQLFPQAADENFDRVGIAIEVLVIEVLDELGAGDDAPLVHHEVAQQTEFERGELDRLAVDGHAGTLGVEHQRSAADLARRMAGAAADERTDSRQHLFHVEGLGHVIIGTGIEARDLVAPAIARGQYQNGGLAPRAA